MRCSRSVSSRLSRRPSLSATISSWSSPGFDSTMNTPVRGLPFSVRMLSSRSHFTNISTNLTRGQAYTIIVTPTWTGTIYGEGYAAWIDYNKDGSLSAAVSEDLNGNGSLDLQFNALEYAAQDLGVHGFRLFRTVTLALTLPMLLPYIIMKAVRSGEKAPQRPWEAAEGLEWEVPSPAPWHTFETPPKLDPTATKVIG